MRHFLCVKNIFLFSFILNLFWMTQFLAKVLQPCHVPIMSKHVISISCPACHVHIMPMSMQMQILDLTVEIFHMHCRQRDWLGCNMTAAEILNFQPDVTWKYIILFIFSLCLNFNGVHILLALGCRLIVLLSLLFCFIFRKSMEDNIAQNYLTPLEDSQVQLFFHRFLMKNHFYP